MTNDDFFWRLHQNNTVLTTGEQDIEARAGSTFTQVQYSITSLPGAFFDDFSL